MCLRVFLVFLSVAALVGAAAFTLGSNSVELACETYVIPLCTRDYNPVCGSDGKTYANKCMLCADNRQNQLNTYVVKKGEC